MLAPGGRDGLDNKPRAPGAAQQTPVATRCLVTEPEGAMILVSCVTRKRSY